MSLIQEALEKAGKIQPAEKFYEIPERLKPEPKHEPVRTAAAKVTQEAVISRASGVKPALNFLVPSRFWIPAGFAAGIILLLWMTSFALGRIGKPSGVMVAGVSSAASRSSSSILPASSVPKFVLTGITNSGSGKLALINNQVVRIGDRLKEKAFVKQIGENYAVLDYNSKEIQLSL